MKTAAASAISDPGWQRSMTNVDAAFTEKQASFITREDACLLGHRSAPRQTCRRAFSLYCVRLLTLRLWHVQQEASHI